MSFNQSQALGAGQREAATVPVYCYVIVHPEEGAIMHVTAWDHAIKITGAPAKLGGPAELTFQPAQCRHGQTSQSADFSLRATEFTIWTEDERLRRYYLSATATKITIYCVRLSSRRALDAATVFDWTTDAQIVASGLLGMLNFAGQAITATLTPEPHLTNGNIGRQMWQRTCNWQLYGPGCKLNKAAFAYSSTILETDAANKRITIAGTPSASAEYFRDGFFKHEPSGLLLPIVLSDHSGTGGKPRFTMNFWTPLLEVGDALTCYPGCRHTAADCQTKFANRANFGGFTNVPNRNPTIHGVI